MITKRELQDMIDRNERESFHRVTGDLMCLLDIVDAVKRGASISEVQSLVEQAEKL